MRTLKKRFNETISDLFVFPYPDGSLAAQDSTQIPKDPALLIYRASFPHINDLVHTRLDVRFDYAKSYMYGKAWITLKPHFYPTDSLSLDAKGMDIKEVAIVQEGIRRSPLKYNYDGSIAAHSPRIKRTITQKITVFTSIIPPNPTS